MKNENRNNTGDIIVSLTDNLALYYRSLLEQARNVQDMALQQLKDEEISRVDYNIIISKTQIPATVLSAMQTYIKDNQAMVDPTEDNAKAITEYTSRLEETRQEIEGKKVEHLKLTEDDDG